MLAQHTVDNNLPISFFFSFSFLTPAHYLAFSSTREPLTIKIWILPEVNVNEIFPRPWHY